MRKYNEKELEAAFNAGRKSIEPILRFEHFGDMEPYASVEVKYSFEKWLSRVNTILPLKKIK